MAHHRGPKTITEDLIFNYDTGNEKSFAGEPTTNVLTNTNLDDGWAKNYHYDIIINDPYPKPAGITSQSVSFKSANSYGYWYSYGDYAPQEDNTTYSVSVWARTVGGNFYITPYTADNGESHRFWMSGKEVIGNGQWQRLTWDSAFTTPINNDSDSLSFNFGSMPIGQRCWLLAPQLEPKSKVTPFVVGTRSNTQSLLDLSKKSVMTVANASFDSNAMLNFDGTNDYVQLTSFPQPTNYITCEAWINPQDLVTPGTIRGGVISSTNSMYLGIFDSADGGSTFGSHWAVQTSTGARPYNVNGQIPRNQWTHIVGTYNGSVSRMYINGVEIWNASLTGTIPSATYYIGTYGGTIVDDTHNFNGYIPVAKIYNRALTAEQVLQNFNASKRRFGL